MAMEVLDERPGGDGGLGLTAQLRHVGPICIVSLSGELHAATVAVLESQVDRLGRTSCNRVVVDMSDVTGLDSTGARVLIGLRHYVRARGGHLTVIGTSPAVRMVLATEQLVSR